MINLNEQQEIAKNMIVNWFRESTTKKLVFTLSGYAGTGKTFLINHIIKNELHLPIEKVAFIAPTGKAASVLIQRGCINASTIHKLIYNRVEIERETEINGKKIKTKKFEFVRKQSIPNFELIVLDEVSMVNEKIMKDIISFGIPILCCGDLAQLPSVEGKSNGYLDNPDYNLTQIVRQSEDNAIIKIATMARNGIPIPTGNYGNVIVTTKDLLTEKQYEKLLVKADQVLCGTNATRRFLNQKIKGYLGLDVNNINIGEKVICLLNNWEKYLDETGDYFLVNGIVGNVIENSILDEELSLSNMTFKADFLQDICEDIVYDNSIFSSNEFKYKQVYLLEDGTYQIKESFLPKKEDESITEFLQRMKELAILKRDVICSEQINFFEPAYCISVHKSQGSEYDNVVLLDESHVFRDDANRWLYTRNYKSKK